MNENRRGMTKDMWAIETRNDEALESAKRICASNLENWIINGRKSSYK
ncbi:hypothetical protein TOT_020000538 [Theileria orientalis strain Shintoku]|uniref:Uncharacterized protein n=1 Tax=Theileria orientalis strain Shintoku TaxID=869250 RepID=J4C871_THEOR|nr:hypothetical protein TOT_020000538 [Theileria orientalis strain Shintoku]BAM40278.1 hypothetical protein TOT_020000538 [Theileria orientalis strain Shintoku]|eukprot:XP_009690579.1 hypothetical protein TOT_020000538 [Theileria orientalis strain Shintoku]